MDVNWTLFGFVLLGLFAFGMIYAMVIALLGELKEGYLAIFVVFGVIITLGGVAIMDLQAAAIAALCFTASGLPMIIGDLYRHITARRDAINRIRGYE